MIDGPRPLEPKGRAQALLTLRAACLSSPDPTLTPASMSWSTSSCTVPNIHSLVPPGCPVGPVLGTSAKSLQLCPTLCDPIDCGLPGSSVVEFSRHEYWSGSVYKYMLHNTLHLHLLVTKSCPTLCNTMDCSLPGSSVHGTFQAIVLEWIAL